MRLKLLSLLVVGAFAGSVSTASAAHVIAYYPLPIWSANMGFDVQPTYGVDSPSNSPQSLPGSYSFSLSLDGASALDQVSGAALPSPTLFVSAYENLGSSAYYSQTGATATLNYSFEIVGPSGTVPTLITAKANTGESYTGATSAGAAAFLDVTGGSTSVIDDSACSGGSGQGCSSGEASSFAVNGTFDLNANQYYNVSLSIGADAFSYQSYPYLPTSGTGYASIDPFIEIDPQFSGAAQYSLGDARYRQCSSSTRTRDMGNVPRRLRCSRIDDARFTPERNCRGLSSGRHIGLKVAAMGRHFRFGGGAPQCPKLAGWGSNFEPRQAEPVKWCHRFCCPPSPRSASFRKITIGP